MFYFTRISFTSLLFSLVVGGLFFAFSNTTAYAQGSVGIGKLPRTTPEVRRTLKTKLVVKSVNAEKYTFQAKDEITNEELTYKVSRSAKITTEKGFFLARGKELSLADLTPGTRLEVNYRESLPTQLTEIKVLKPKEKE